MTEQINPGTIYYLITWLMIIYLIYRAIVAILIRFPKLNIFGCRKS